MQAALKKHWANYKESKSCSSVQNFKNRRSCSMVTSTFDLTLNQVICWSVSLLQLTRTLWLINCLLFSLPLRSYFIHIHMKSSAPYESTILKIIEKDCNLFSKNSSYFFCSQRIQNQFSKKSPLIRVKSCNSTYTESILWGTERETKNSKGHYLKYYIINLYNPARKVQI